MTPYLALLTGLFFLTSLYLIQSRHVIRLVVGIAVLGNAVNLLLFVSGRITRDAAPIISKGAETLSLSAANALPQALILTAIVISFSFFSFMLVLIWRSSQVLKTDNSDRMRLAEPEAQPLPPTEW